MSRKLRSAFIRMFYISGILFLLISIATDAWPLMPNEGVQVIRRISQQKGFEERIAKNALILVYGDKTLRPQAVNELQTTLPVWERIQQGLEKGDASLGLPGSTPREVDVLISQIRTDFIAIDTASRAILVRPDDPANATQLSIVLAHSQPYYLKMSDISDVWQDKTQDVGKIYFGIKLGIGLVLLVFWILLIILHKRQSKQKEHHS